MYDYKVMKRFCLRLSFVLWVLSMMVLNSCSDSDYINAIPASSTALISIDMPKMAETNHLEEKAGILKSLLHVDDVSDCGIDISEKLYLFEASDGNLGLCAKVSSESDLEKWLNQLADKQHLCTKVKIGRAHV